MYMEDINSKIKLAQTELNLEHDLSKRTVITKRLNILYLKKEIEDIKLKIKQLS